ncbi:copper oxidase [Halioglobus maricola]|uniref:Copper oxidase n=1 Tax=Halioglobus maricola TaxID=2601894 RepID=A0A5P9NH14_9GAMM|nr:multicopper oxidase domain-containing protein [Halioglobus maricola]QFU75110.1 copper oxidase [Halioglobus maricola]
MKYLILALALVAGAANAAVVEYELTIGYGALNKSGEPVTAMLVNDSYPGPVLRFKQDDTARIRVTNELDVDSSIHWHGLLLPPAQDGVPYMSSLPIGPGETFEYEFPLKHAGTYWYHSHTDLQEQSGVHGGIVVEPPGGSSGQAEAVVVLQDWTDEDPHQVLHNLKKDGHYYALKKDSVVSIAGYLQRGAMGNWWESRWTRMGAMDVADVGYDAFLANGEPEIRLFEHALPGERVRLRLINAGASTYFLLHSAGLDSRVIAADGLDVKPVPVDEVLHAVAETYDLEIAVPDSGAAELRASAQDGSGYASILIGRGAPRHAEPMTPPDLYASHSGHDMTGDGAHDHHHIHHGGPRRLAYSDLDTLEAQRYAGGPEARTIDLRLTGNMETYNWSFNNIPLSRADKILVERGETVRFRFINETMMHHPLHLHGHFFRVITAAGKGPMKHTVDVPPLATVEIEFLANEEQDWFFHCHNLYHAKTGMARVVRYSDYNGNPEFMAAKKSSPDIRDTDFYFAAELKLHNQLGMAEGWTANARHRFEFEAQSLDWEEERGDLAYLYRLNRWTQALAGLEKEAGEDVEYRLGLRYVLPMMVDMDLYLTDEGDVEVAFDTHFQLTKRVQAHWEWESEGEYHLGVEYRFNERISAEAAYTDTVDASLGVKLRF